MSLPDEEITKVHRVRKTCFEMLKDRGYAIEDSEINMTRKEFIDKFNGTIRREDLTFLKTKPDNADPIYVFFPDDLKIGAKIMKHYVVRLENEKIRRAIIVVRVGLTHYAKDALTAAGLFRLEVFLEAELLVNIRYHNLVPEHIPITAQEKAELLKKYTFKKDAPIQSQLPRILITDPISRYYGLSRGQIVKILRPIETGTSEKDNDDFDSNKRDRNAEICYVSYRMVS